MKKLRITVEGKTYEVVVESVDDPSTRAARPAVAARPVAAASAPAPVATASAAASGSAASIRSQLAGRIVAVDVTVGAEVKAGQQLLVLEAMKMNTPVVSPKDGKVSAIHVAAGDTVDEGQALIDVE